ncbi:MAG: hypothetical protein L0312_12870, partial [Acidobacteria bacterium]|nr:hypothetical protein [Acidobacteriota bacterium]
MSDHTSYLEPPKIDASLDLCLFIERNLYTAVVSDSLDELGLRLFTRPRRGVVRLTNGARYEE